MRNDKCKAAACLSIITHHLAFIIAMSFLPLLHQAVALHQAGRLAEAEPLYMQVLAIDPGQPDSLHLLGVMAHQLGRHEEAVNLIRRAVATFAANVDMHNNLGVALLALKRYAEAEASFVAALSLAPDHADAWHNRATALRGQMKLAEAETACQQALRCNPRHADAHDQLGLLLQARGQLDEASECYCQALIANPSHVRARVHLGIIASAHSQWDESRCLFDEALKLAPQNLEALLGLGAMLHDQGLSVEATAVFEQAVAAHPQHAGAHAALGTALQKIGRTDDARRQLTESLRLKPSDGVRLRLAMTPYIIAPSSELLDRQRRQLEADITELESISLHVDNPLNEIGAAPFYYAYHGFEIRSAFKRLARLLERAAPSVQYTAPHCRTDAPKRQTDGPIRVGIVSKFFHDHPVGKFYLGLVRQLARPQFHVTALTMSHVDDEVSRALPVAADAIVRLPPDFLTARQQIANQQLDVLVYTDIGMDPWTYYLAFARLAPVQCVLLGHPITTGIPALDYFVSSRHFESTEGASHYTERLVTLETLPTCIERPQLPERIKSRSELGLPVDGHLYMSAQTVYKYHPDYDELFARILRVDPHGRLVIFAGRIDEWTALLKQRLSVAMPDVFDRIVWLSRLSHADYLQAMTHADAMLDTPAFNGGTTTLDALAVGAPVVTLPGPYLRMRMSLGYYSAIGVRDLIASDRDDYVRLALCLANKPAWREEIRQRILARCEALFDSRGFVEEFQRFLVLAVPGKA